MVYDYYPYWTPPVSPPPQRLFLRLSCPQSCAEAGPGGAGVGPAAVCPLPPASSACAAAPALNGGSPSGGEPQIRRGAPEREQLETKHFERLPLGQSHPGKGSGIAGKARDGAAGLKTGWRIRSGSAERTGTPNSQREKLPCRLQLPLSDKSFSRIHVFFVPYISTCVIGDDPRCRRLPSISLVHSAAHISRNLNLQPLICPQRHV